MRKLLLSLLGVTAVLLIEAQTPIADEEFKLGYTPNEKGGTVLFPGKSHSFAPDIVGKEVKTTDNPGFFLVRNHIVQTSTMPLPPSKKENQVSQQIYMPTICFNQVLALNIAILKGEDFPEQQQRLNKLANTLKTSDHTL